MSLLQVRGVSRRFTGAHGDTLALQATDLQVESSALRRLLALAPDA